MKQKNKVILFSVVAVLALFAVPSVSATYPANAVYFDPEDSSGEFYEDTYMVVMVNASVKTFTVAMEIFFNPDCVNITDVDFTGTPYSSNTGWTHWGDYVRIGAMQLGSPVDPGIHLVANLTLHCESETYCESGLEFTETELTDDDYATLPDVIWYNGTFTCEAAPGIADHVVISEVQISGATANDEFVELYNPTNAPISLKDWYLTKKTSGGTSEYHLLAGFPATSIPAHGFFLITHQSGYTGPVTADATYGTTNSIAANNTVILYSDNKITVVDKVGFGAALDNETMSYSDNPGDDESLQRKINATIERDGYGPAWDTGNNSADFFIQTSNPRNSVSDPVEPIPELSTLMLLTTGLVALVGYVIVKKGRKG